MKANATMSDISCGARASAMAGAFTAVTGGAESLCSNPASLVETQSPEFTAVYGRLYSGLSDDSKIGQGYFGLALPFSGKYGGVGGASWNDTRLSEAFSESAYSVSYATSVYRGLGAGLSLKYLRRGYVSDDYTAVDPVFSDGYSKGALAADLGFFYRPAPRYGLGLALRNLNRPDLGLASADRLPVEVRTGASYAFRTSLLALDAAFAGQDFNVSAGAEYSFQRRYALRMGFSAGNDSRRSVNLGLGGRFGLAAFDYAFSLPIGGVSGTIGSHRLAFSFRFGAEADMQSAAELAAAAELKRAQDKASSQEAQIRALEQKLDAVDRQVQSAPVQPAAQPAVQPAAPAAAETAVPAAQPAVQPAIVKQIESLKSELEKSRVEMQAIKARAAAKPAAAPKPAPAKPQPAARRTYVAKEGDTLESIAASVYGDPDRWPEIYRANAGSLGRGGEVKQGQVLVLP